MDIISYLNQSNIYEDELTKIKVFQKKYGIT